ncbi:DUF456 domain-containing protein [Fulvivirga lutea]|uniref:DUF456 domain-containing protein n=1 Tax=Fulvivirga lutea TaxID=2810512 RepID=A0A974WGW7_9BACT|nr:DUF456 domain-containing protein [Fulvivirga lutea]QSE97654.1 DUF456 domain-containing protein [Fulvivirga lutea]
MDIVIYLFSGLLMIIGILGCFLPIIPGPPLSYVGLLLLQLTDQAPFTNKFLLIWAGVTIVAQGLDYVVPTYGTKKYGGSRAGVSGSVVGLILGVLFFPPLGIIIGPMLGAFVGELMVGRERKEAMRSAWGSFIGFLFGTLIKLIASLMMTYYFVKAVIDLF